MAAFPSAVSNKDILSSLRHWSPWASTSFVGKHPPILARSPTHTQGNPQHLGREPSPVISSFRATREVLSGLLLFCLFDCQCLAGMAEVKSPDRAASVECWALMEAVPWCFLIMTLRQSSLPILSKNRALCGKVLRH